MRLLKLVVDGVELFKDGKMSLDFFATDRVSKTEDDNYMDVYKIGNHGSIFSESITGITGVNAAGKTTVLNLVSIALWILGQSSIIRTFSNARAKRVGKIKNHIKVTCIFWVKDTFYMIESELKNNYDYSEGHERKYPLDGFVFLNETLWKFDSKNITREIIKNPDDFKAHSKIFKKRYSDSDDDNNDEVILTDSERTFLNDSISIASMLTERNVPIYQHRSELSTESLATPLVQAFDNSVERLDWDDDSQVFFLKFANEEEKAVSRDVAMATLSAGTIAGAELVRNAIRILRAGSYLIIDEIEQHLNKSLVGAVIELFASPVTNPYGAQLVFTTHYPQVLDTIHRKDNVYLLIRNKAHKAEIVKYSDKIKRIENKKSEVVLSNFIKGTLPNYPDVQAMREFVRESVNE